MSVNNNFNIESGGVGIQTQNNNEYSNDPKSEIKHSEVPSSPKVQKSKHQFVIFSVICFVILTIMLPILTGGFGNLLGEWLKLVFKTSLHLP